MRWCFDVIGPDARPKQIIFYAEIVQKSFQSFRNCLKRYNTRFQILI